MRSPTVVFASKKEPTPAGRIIAQTISSMYGRLVEVRADVVHIATIAFLMRPQPVVEATDLAFTTRSHNRLVRIESGRSNRDRQGRNELGEFFAKEPRCWDQGCERPKRSPAKHLGPLLRIHEPLQCREEPKDSKQLLNQNVFARLPLKLIN